jgi:hypothetical protein
MTAEPIDVTVTVYGPGREPEDLKFKGITAAEVITAVDGNVPLEGGYLWLYKGQDPDRLAVATFTPGHWLRYQVDEGSDTT